MLMIWLIDYHIEIVTNYKKYLTFKLAFTTCQNYIICIYGILLYRQIKYKVFEH